MQIPSMGDSGRQKLTNGFYGVVTGRRVARAIGQENAVRSMAQGFLGLGPCGYYSQLAAGLLQQAPECCV